MGFWLLRHGFVSLRVTKSRGGGAGAPGAQPGRGPWGDSATLGARKLAGSSDCSPSPSLLPCRLRGVDCPSGRTSWAGKIHRENAPGLGCGAGKRRAPAASGECRVRDPHPPAALPGIDSLRERGESAESLGLPAPRELPLLPSPGKAREWDEEAVAEVGALGPGREGLLGWSGDGAGSSLFHGLRCSLEDREQGSCAFHPGEASGNGTKRGFGWEKRSFRPENPIPANTGNGRCVLLGCFLFFPLECCLWVPSSRSGPWDGSGALPKVTPGCSRLDPGRGAVPRAGGMRELREKLEFWHAQQRPGCFKMDPVALWCFRGAPGSCRGQKQESCDFSRDADSFLSARAPGKPPPSLADTEGLLCSKKFCSKKTLLSLLKKRIPQI